MMDDIGGTHSRSLSPYSGGRGLGQKGASSLDMPEVALRQADWEKQIESLDQREIELHQTQLRLIREQTSSFMHDLAALRKEFLAMKAKQESVHASIEPTVDGKVQEIWQCLERFRNDHEASHGALHSRVRGVETSILPQLREFDLKLEQHRASLDEREDGHNRLMDLMRQHGDSVARVAGSHQDEKKLMNERIERLERERLDRVEGQQSQLSKQLSAWEDDLRELRELVGGERMARETYHGSIRTMQDSIKKHFSDEKAARESHQASVGEHLEKRLSEESERLQKHHAPLQERLQYLEKLLGESADAALEHNLMRRSASGQFLLQGSQPSSIVDRLALLERSLGDSVDKHSRSLKGAQDKLDHLDGRFGDQQTAHASLQERIAYLEQVLNESVGKHVEELTASKLRLEQLHSRLEKSGLSLGELQKAHSGLANDVATKNAHHASLADRVAFLERTMGDSAEKHSSDLASLKAAHSKHESALSKHGKDVENLRGSFTQTVEDRLSSLERALNDHSDRHDQRLEHVQGRLSACEASTNGVADLRKGHADLSSHKQTIQAHHASLKERVDFLERTVGDSADKHGRDLQAALTKIEQMQNRLSGCEKHGQSISELQKSHAGLSSQNTAASSHQASLQERVDYLESQLGDAASKHAKELELLKSSHAKHADELKSLRNTRGDHATMADRLAYLEQALGESVEKHASALSAAHSKLESMHARLASCEQHGPALADLKKGHSSLSSDKSALEVQHSSLRDRLDQLEGVLSGPGDRKALDFAHSKIEQLTGRLSACERHGTQLGELQKTLQDTAEKKQRLETDHATLRERVDYLESLLGDSADKHVKELEALKAAHAKHVSESKAGHGRLTDVLAQEKEARDEHHSSVTRRLQFLEDAVGASADRHSRSIEAQAGDLESIRAAHAKNARDLQDLAKLHDKHCSMEDRLAYVEKALGDSAEKHSSAHGKIEQLASKIAEERNAREAHHGQIGSQLREQSEAREAHQQTVTQRLAKLEGLVSSTADRHSRDLDKLVNEGKGKDSKHATLEERIKYIEQAMGDSVEKHVQERASLQTRVDQLHARLAEERAARDAHQSCVQDHISAEKDAREAHHSNLVERIQYLEGAISDSADKHTRELEGHKASHAKLVNESRSRDGQHASLVERVEYLEKTLRDAAEKNTKAIEGHVGRLDQMFTRVSAVERQCNSIADLQRAHSSLTSDKAKLEAHHATLEERISFLEGTLGDNVEKHAKALDAIRLDHAKLSGDVKVRHSQQDAHQTSVSERLIFLEKAIGDSADKHKQALDAAHAKIDAMHGRISQSEANSKALASLKQANASLTNEKSGLEAHHASTAERLDYLEKVLGDSVDKHAQELAEAHRKIETLHGRVSEERAGREGHHSQISDFLSRERATREAQHSSVQERLEHLESYLGQSSRELQTQHGSTHSRIGSIEQRFGDELAELRELVSAERQSRVQHHDAVTQHLDGERRARETYERGVQSHLTGEKKAREMLEQMIQEQLSLDRAARDRHHEHIQEVVLREKEAREKHLETHQHSLQRETKIREAALKELHDSLSKERKLRDDHMSTHGDALNKEQAARRDMEALLHSERAERLRHHETIGERVESLQRTVNIFDTLIRKEMEERGRQSKQLWDAIDNHTHDLSTQVLDITDKEAISKAQDAMPVSSVTSEVSPASRAVPTQPLGSSVRTVSSGVAPAAPPVFAWNSRPSTPPPEGPALQPGGCASPPVCVSPPVPMLQRTPSAVVPVAVQHVGPVPQGGLLRVRSPVREARSVANAPVALAPVPAKAGQPMAPAPARVLPSPAQLQGASLQGAMVNAAAALASQAAFDSLDRNHDGVLSRAEFTAALTGGGSPMSGGSATPQQRMKSPVAKDVRVEQMVTCGPSRLPADRPVSPRMVQPVVTG